MLILNVLEDHVVVLLATQAHASVNPAMIKEFLALQTKVVVPLPPPLPILASKMVVTAHLNPVVMIAAALGAVVVGTAVKPVPPRLRLRPALPCQLPRLLLVAALILFIVVLLLAARGLVEVMIVIILILLIMRRFMITATVFVQTFIMVI